MPENYFMFIVTLFTITKKLCAQQLINKEGAGVLFTHKEE
jgi:hypothetical protein